jgi:hypothetical protein
MHSQTEQMTTSRPRATRDGCARPDFSRAGATNAADTASDNAVSSLWKASWAQLRACHPDLEIRLAGLRPTRSRALARLEASAARWSGRCLRGEAKPAALLLKLQVWQAAVVAELEREL